MWDGLLFDNADMFDCSPRSCPCAPAVRVPQPAGFPFCAFTGI